MTSKSPMRVFMTRWGSEKGGLVRASFGCMMTTHVRHFHSHSRKETTHHTHAYMTALKNMRGRHAKNAHAPFPINFQTHAHLHLDKLGQPSIEEKPVFRSWHPTHRRCDFALPLPAPTPLSLTLLVDCLREYACPILSRP